MAYDTKHSFTADANCGMCHTCPFSPDTCGLDPQICHLTYGKSEDDHNHGYLALGEVYSAIEAMVNKPGGYHHHQTKEFIRAIQP